VLYLWLNYSHIWWMIIKRFVLCIWVSYSQIIWLNLLKGMIIDGSSTFATSSNGWSSPLLLHHKKPQKKKNTLILPGFTLDETSFFWWHVLLGLGLYFLVSHRMNWVFLPVESIQQKCVGLGGEWVSTESKVWLS